jgi:hypothetical protein
METHLIAGNFEEASRTYDRYRRSFPSDGLAVLRTSEMLEKLGRKQEAAQLLKTISLDPQYGDEAQRRLRLLLPSS